jgi:hypothetical protein
MTNLPGTYALPVSIHICQSLDNLGNFHEFIEKVMRALVILAMAAAAVTLTSTVSADKYGDLVAKGFRWANVNGLYACVSKDDVRRMVNNRSDEVLLKMVEQVKAYYLTPGALVQVVEEDPQSGLSKIRLAGITVDLWTLTKFLSKQPRKDTYGVVETPETSGLIPSAAATGIDAGPSPPPEFNPSPGMSPVPGMSPLPEMSPVPGMGPLPEMSPVPGMSPLPEMSPVPATSPTPGATLTPTPQANQ